jgi:integrase
MSEDITVPLCNRAVSLLKRRREASPDDATFVFPAHSASGHVVEPKRKWWALRDKADVTDLHLHDLRRTVATWATREGIPYPTVSAMLGHKVEGVTGVYTPPDIESVRDGFEKAIDALLKAAKPAKPTRRKRGT